MKRFFSICLLAILVFTLFSCDNTPFCRPDDSGSADVSGNYNSSSVLTSYYENTFPASDAPTDYVQFTLSGGATFVVALYSTYAPKTVAHFKELVAAHAYDGSTFHRVQENYCIYGGADAKKESADKTGVEGEFSANGYEGNLLTHTKGTMSLYHGDDDKNGADTEFFIMLTDSKTRDGKYAAFARVIYGMETVEAIGRVPVTTQKGVNKENSLPKTEIIIESVYFVTIPEGGSSGNSGSNDAVR